MDAAGLRAGDARLRPRSALAGLLLATLLPFAAWGGTLKLLYVEPNVGTASGGHLALAFGERVYHFQNAGPEHLRMGRLSADFFRYAYSVRENRGIRLIEVELADGAWRSLRRAFDERYLGERRQLALLAAVQDDRRLIEGLAARAGLRSGEARSSTETPTGRPFALRGAGLFEPGGAPAASLLETRGRAAARHGAGFLADRRRELAEQVRALAPEVAPAAWVALDRPAPAGSLFAERFARLSLERFALRVLDEAMPVARSALREVPGELGALSAGERQRLAVFAAGLEQRAVELLRSPRADRGYPLLLALARRQAIEASLARGRWVVLDAFPDAVPAWPAASVESRRAFVDALRLGAARELRALRQAAAGAPLGEREYSGLEEAANRLAELEGGRTGERDVRLRGERLLPERRAVPPDAVLPAAPGADWTALVAAARQREARLLEALEALHGYHLFTHNCATEIFRTLESRLPPAEVERALGGRVAPDGLLHFVPRVAFERARSRYRVAAVGEIPSFRRTRLEAREQRDGALRAWLAESNTLRSSVYRPNPQDAWFVFFTDDRVWPRPLLGAVNLAAGAGQTALGLLTLPFDRGGQLRRGALGVAFSLPELVFLSWRKGTLEVARGETPRTWLHPASP